MVGGVRTIVLCLALVADLALAQLRDPTRPPGGGADAPALAADAGTESGVSAIFLRSGAKPAALVDGVYVEQGGKLGDRRVIKITEATVVLRAADGSREVMKLVPGVQKEPVVPKKKPGEKSVPRAAKGSEAK